MKFGKKNEIQINPLKYNLALIGESGIGKTTVIKEYCEKLAGEDGYIFLEVGKEDGASAISGINYITCPEWDADYDEDTNTMGFNTFIEDVVENKATDWKDLKVVVLDTYDEIFSIGEQEVIRMHNKENPQKRAKSINSCFGGYGAGLEKTIEIVLNALWSLKTVGVSFIVIGHTKSKNIIDPVTGEEYAQLTSNMTQKYFNAIKTKVHFLGVAAIDREITRKSTGKKDNKGNDIKKGVVQGESRWITFRDDSYTIDSKSRFADIVDRIPLDADALIKALTDAIKAEASKSGMDIKTLEKSQAKADQAKAKQVAEAEKAHKSQKELDIAIGEIVDFFTKNKTDLEIIKPILSKCKEMGYSNPKEISNLEDAKIILAMTLK